MQKQCQSKSVSFSVKKSAHTEVAPLDSSCPHCEKLNLVTLHIQIVLFSEPAGPSSTSPLEPKRKKKWSHQAEKRGGSKLMSAQRPRALLSPQPNKSPVIFTREDQCPLPCVSGLVSFAGSEEELDSKSLAASDYEECANSSDDSSPLPKQSDEQPRMESSLKPSRNSS